MSVQTPADENLEEAKVAVQTAIDNLASIVISKCHGSDDYNPTYRDTLQASLNDLLNVRKALK